MTGCAGSPIERRLSAYAEEAWQQRLSAIYARHARLGPASLVLYDVSTLYFEINRGDRFCEPRFSKERRLELRITTGVITGQDGFPLMDSAFEGNRAGTKPILPVKDKRRDQRMYCQFTVGRTRRTLRGINEQVAKAAKAVRSRST